MEPKRVVQLSDFDKATVLEAVEANEIYIIKDGDKELAWLIPSQKPDAAVNRKPGQLKGKLKVGDEFFEPLPEDMLGDK